MKRVLRFILSLIEVLIILYAIVITSFVLCRNKYGFTQIGDYTFTSIQESDVPSLEDVKAGQLLLIKKSKGIQKGDRIYYYVAQDEAYTIRNDYVSKVSESNGQTLYGIERNNELITVFESRVLGKYSNTLNHLGTILDFLESRTGFLCCVLLPVLLVFIYQLYEFIHLLHVDSKKNYQEIDPEELKAELKESILERREEQEKQESETEKKEDIEML